MRLQLELIIDDFLKAGRPKKVEGGGTRPPSVEDYVELLMKNRGLMYSWIHAIAANCPEVWADLVVWAKAAFAKFGEQGATQGMDERLQSLFDTLPDNSYSQFDLEMKAMSDFTSLDSSSFDLLDFPA